MKKLLTVLIVLTLGLACLAAVAEGGADAIAGRLEDGRYILTIPVKDGDMDDWALDQMDASVVRLLEVKGENGVLTAIYDPVADGEATVVLKRMRGIACVEKHTFDLVVKDGKIAETTGGSYTAAPADDELNAVLSGEWWEKDTQFTVMTLSLAADGGWTAEIVSPMTREASVTRFNVLYDCDTDALIYQGGQRFSLTAEGEPGDELPAEKMAGQISLGGTEEAIELTWTDENGREITFVRADPLPAYTYSGDDPIEGAVAEYLAKRFSADEFRSEAGAVDIPAPVIFKTEQPDDAHAKVYGGFWHLVYARRGNVLYCISGGEYAGAMSLEKDSEGWKVTDFEEAGDGEDYYPDILRICGGDEKLAGKIASSANAAEDPLLSVRRRFVRDYVEANGLNFTAYQDYGWDPVPLVE